MLTLLKLHYLTEMAAAASALAALIQVAVSEYHSVRGHHEVSARAFRWFLAVAIIYVLTQAIHLVTIYFVHGR